MLNIKLIASFKIKNVEKNINDFKFLLIYFFLLKKSSKIRKNLNNKVIKLIFKSKSTF